ncbi:MAG: YerC/YecD family TrpR-related protein [bacterium]|nr:YerC/YecD family TrpR-related protein [bacterium]
MAKYTPHQKLNIEKKQEVLLELCHAIAVVKSLPEVAKVLGDLLSDQEIQMIGKRLQIAKLLLAGRKYIDIKSELRVSQPTIARINLWLQQAGDGFRLLIKKGIGKEKIKIPEWKPFPEAQGEWAKLKRRYPLHFWPQLLVEDLVRNASNRQRKKLLVTLSIIKKSGKMKKEVLRHVNFLLLAGESANKHKVT